MNLLALAQSLQGVPLSALKNLLLQVPYKASIFTASRTQVKCNITSFKIFLRSLINLFPCMPSNVLLLEGVKLSFLDDIALSFISLVAKTCPVVDLSS